MKRGPADVPALPLEPAALLQLQLQLGLAGDRTLAAHLGSCELCTAASGMWQRRWRRRPWQWQAHYFWTASWTKKVCR
eukprot:scaffold23491_cov66-Phaeocystis_antarctica.AAC.2